jgi:hypothetical protein
LCAAPKTNANVNFEATGTVPGTEDADTIEVVTSAVERQMSAFAKRMGHVLAKVSGKCCFAKLQTSAVTPAAQAANQCCPGCVKLM